MNCERAKELILTDYLDGRLMPPKDNELQSHLSSCAKCRDLLTQAKKNLVDPFSTPNKQSLSQETVWLKIKKQIEDEESEQIFSNSFLDVFSKFKESVTSFKPALSFTIVMIILVLFAYFKSMSQPQIVEPLPLEEEQLLAYGESELSVIQSDDNDDYGTEIEEYFL